MKNKSYKKFNRLGIVSFNEISSVIGKQDTIELFGKKVGVNSLKLQSFIKNRKCVECNIEGNTFAVEKDACLKSETRYHLNLYYFDEDNNETLITRDHIIPEAFGGKNSLDNLQTMCERCNVRKGHKIDLSKISLSKLLEMYDILNKRTPNKSTDHKDLIWAAIIEKRKSLIIA